MSRYAYDSTTETMTPIAGLPIVDTTLDSTSDNPIANSAVAGKIGTITSQTLAASATSVTFIGLPTTGNHIIDFFTSTGINYTAIDSSISGQVTLTFPAQQAAVTVYCRVSEV